MFNKKSLLSWFSIGCRIALVSLLLLILAGGIVRSSGSGMGCPDLPKCFNRLIPPTQEKDLPLGYEQKYLEKRILKNIRLSKLFGKLGFKELSDKIFLDPSIRKIEPFNVWNTWTEYINRLVGMLTGLVFLGLFIMSIGLWKIDSSLFWLSGLNLLLIGIQALVGSWVVSTHLLSGLISFHMMLALLILIILLGIYGKVYFSHLEPNSSNNHIGKFIPYFLMAIVLINGIQILLGTLVRESLDGHTLPLINAENFLDWAGDYFPLHRMLSFLLLALNVYLGIYFWKEKDKNQIIYKQARISLIILIVQIILGLSLVWGPLPPFSQALHVFFAVLLFSSQVWTFMIWIGLYKAPRQNIRLRYA